MPCSFYLREEKLHGTEMRGKVVDNSLIYLLDDFKLKGIGSNIHNKEKKIYRENGFYQIHLKAAYDGLIYWPHSKFKFVDPHAETSLVAQWKAYVADSQGLNLNGKDYLGVIKNVVSFKDIEKKYLMPEDVTKPKFTDWLSTKEISLNSKMYKNL